MHKNLTLALGGLATIGVLAGASYFSGSSLLSSVLTTTTPPVCQEQENDVALARQALEKFPERANITERIAVLQEAVRNAEGKVKELEQGAFAAAKKLRYPDLNTLMSDYQKYTNLLTKKNNQNTQIRASNAEITRLSRIRPRTADISAQIKKEQIKLSSLKNELAKISKELSTLNAGIKKITRSSATIDVLYNKYLKKAVSELSSAQKALGEAQKALETVLAEQQPIRDAEAKLVAAENALKLCQQTMSGEAEIGVDDAQYCYPTLVQPDGTSTKECVTDPSKIPPCYVKSELVESTYTDMDGNEQVSHSVKPDDNTKELYFCGTPEQYTDPADPLKNYPTALGTGSLGDGSQPAPAAPMGEKNPNDPRNKPSNKEKYPDTDESGNIYMGCFRETQEHLLPCSCEALSGSIRYPNGQPMPSTGFAIDGLNCESKVVVKNGNEVNEWTWICPNRGEAADSCSLDLPIMDTYEECSSHDINPECGFPFIRDNYVGDNDIGLYAYCAKGEMSDLEEDGNKFTWKCGCPSTGEYVSCQDNTVKCGDNSCDEGESEFTCPSDCKEKE